jgi:hypothetical protein
MAVGRAAWQTIFQISPIFLQGGIVPGWIPGGMLPIILATEVLAFPFGTLTSAATALASAATFLSANAGRSFNLDNSFAHFTPGAGAVVVNQQIATYPFANQSVAANSVITQPMQISFTMTCPARGPVSYWLKLPKMMALIDTLRRHNAKGGMYALVTPSFVYFDCLMQTMRDASGSQTKQVQNVWTLDFQKPLLTVEDATAAEQGLNTILDKITGGQRINGMPSTTPPIVNTTANVGGSVSGVGSS